MECQYYELQRSEGPSRCYCYVISSFLVFGKSRHPREHLAFLSEKYIMLLPTGLVVEYFGHLNVERTFVILNTQAN